MSNAKLVILFLKSGLDPRGLLDKVLPVCKIIGHDFERFYKCAVCGIHITQTKEYKEDMKKTFPDRSEG